MKRMLSAVCLSILCLTAEASWTEDWKVKGGFQTRDAKGFDFSTKPALNGHEGNVPTPSKKTTGTTWTKTDEFSEFDDFLGSFSFDFKLRDGHNLIHLGDDYYQGDLSIDFGYAPQTVSTWTKTVENAFQNAVADDFDEEGSGMFLSASKKIAERGRWIFELECAWAQNDFSGKNSATPLRQSILLTKKAVTRYFYYIVESIGSFAQGGPITSGNFSSDFLDGDFDSDNIQVGYIQTESPEPNYYDDLAIEFSGKTKPGDKTVRTTQTFVFTNQYSNQLDVDMNTVSLGANALLSLGKDGKISFISELGATLNLLDMQGQYLETFKNAETGEVVAHISDKASDDVVKVGFYAGFGLEAQLLPRFSVGGLFRYDYVGEETLSVGQSELAFDGSGFGGQLYGKFLLA